MEPVMPGGSIFVSYSHAPGDAAAAFRIVKKLRTAGCLVWLDDERLICGDDFDSNLEDAVCRHCGFFIFVISRTTEGRSESYYHKERNWAAQRVQSMTHSRPFYFPVAIDDSLRVTSRALLQTSTLSRRLAARSALRSPHASPPCSSVS